MGRRKSQPKKSPGSTESRRHHQLASAEEAVLRHRRPVQKASLILPKATFIRIANEILHEVGGTHLRFTTSAMETLQNACEKYMANAYVGSNSVTSNYQRSMILPRDIQLSQHLSGNDDETNK